MEGKYRFYVAQEFEAQRITNYFQDVKKALEFFDSFSVDIMKKQKILRVSIHDRIYYGRHLKVRKGNELFLAKEEGTDGEDIFER